MTNKEDVFGGEPFEDYPYVELSEEELDELHSITDEIDDIVTYSTNTFKSGQCGVGFAGELAFAHYYGLDMEIVVGESDGGVDFEVYHLPSDQIGTIDVKTITYGGGDLLIKDEKELAADVYFLLEKRGSAYGLIGYCSRSEAAQAEVYPPGEYSPMRVKRIPREALHQSPESDELRGIPESATDL